MTDTMRDKILYYSYYTINHKTGFNKACFNFFILFKKHTVYTFRPQAVKQVYLLKWPLGVNMFEKYIVVAKRDLQELRGECFLRL